jgi:hypothetical protein
MNQDSFVSWLSVSSVFAAISFDSESFSLASSSRLNLILKYNEIFTNKTRIKLRLNDRDFGQATNKKQFLTAFKKSKKPFNPLTIQK